MNFVSKIKGIVVLDKVIDNTKFYANKLKVSGARKRMLRLILYDAPAELTE